MEPDASQKCPAKGREETGTSCSKRHFSLIYWEGTFSPVTQSTVKDNPALSKGRTTEVPPYLRQIFDCDGAVLQVQKKPL